MGVISVLKTTGNAVQSVASTIKNTHDSLNNNIKKASDFLNNADVIMLNKLKTASTNFAKKMLEEQRPNQEKITKSKEELASDFIQNVGVSIAEQTQDIDPQNGRTLNKISRTLEIISGQIKSISNFIIDRQDTSIKRASLESPSGNQIAQNSQQTSNSNDFLSSITGMLSGLLGLAPAVFMKFLKGFKAFLSNPLKFLMNVIKGGFGGFKALISPLLLPLNNSIKFMSQKWDSLIEYIHKFTSIDLEKFKISNKLNDFEANSKNKINDFDAGTKNKIDDFEAGSKKVSNLTQNIKNVDAPWYKKASDSVSNAVGEVWNGFKKTNFGKWTIEVADDISSYAGKTWESFKDTRIGNILSSGYNKLSAMGKALVESSINTFDKVKNLVSESIDKTITMAKMGASKVAEAVIKPFVSWVKSGFNKLFGNTKLGKYLPKVLDNINPIMKRLSAAGAKAASKIIPGVGFAVGVYCAIDYFLNQKYILGTLAAISACISLVPGIGGIIAMCLDLGIFAADAIMNDPDEVEALNKEQNDIQDKLVQMQKDPNNSGLKEPLNQKYYVDSRERDYTNFSGLTQSQAVWAEEATHSYNKELNDAENNIVKIKTEIALLSSKNIDTSDLNNELNMQIENKEKIKDEFSNINKRIELTKWKNYDELFEDDEKYNLLRKKWKESDKKRKDVHNLISKKNQHIAENNDKMIKKYEDEADDKKRNEVQYLISKKNQRIAENDYKMIKKYEDEANFYKEELIKYLNSKDDSEFKNLVHKNKLNGDSKISYAPENIIEIKTNEKNMEAQYITDNAPDTVSNTMSEQSVASNCLEGECLTPKGEKTGGTYASRAAAEFAKRKGGSKSQKRCATYVRAYLQSAGYPLKTFPEHAKDYVNYLPTIGFDMVGTADKVSPQIGDIIVSPPPYGATSGHIAIYTGESVKPWVSDFKHGINVYGAARGVPNNAIQVFRDTQNIVPKEVVDANLKQADKAFNISINKKIPINFSNAINVSDTLKTSNNDLSNNDLSNNLDDKPINLIKNEVAMNNAPLIKNNNLESDLNLKQFTNYDFVPKNTNLIEQASGLKDLGNDYEYLNNSSEDDVFNLTGKTKTEWVEYFGWNTKVAAKDSINVKTKETKQVIVNNNNTQNVNSSESLKPTHNDLTDSFILS